MSDTVTRARRPPTVVRYWKTRVTVTRGPDQGATVAFAGNSVRVGTASDNDLIRKDDTVSRLHCELEAVPAGVRVVDRGSPTVCRSPVCACMTRSYPATPVCGSETPSSRSPPSARPSTRCRPRPTGWPSAWLGAANARVVRRARADSPHRRHGAHRGRNGHGEGRSGRVTPSGIQPKRGPVRRVRLRRGRGHAHRASCSDTSAGPSLARCKRAPGCSSKRTKARSFSTKSGASEGFSPSCCALERREVRRVGGSRVLEVDVRVIAATNRSLRHEVQKNNFRPDWYYRLSTALVQMPPLRDCMEDLSLLVAHFLAMERPPRSIDDVSPMAWEMLRAHRWPGNVRELRNAVQRLSFRPNRPLEETTSGLAGEGHPCGRSHRSWGRALAAPVGAPGRERRVRTSVPDERPGFDPGQRDACSREGRGFAANDAETDEETRLGEGRG